MAKKLRNMQNWNPVMKWAEKEGWSASSFLLNTKGDYANRNQTDQTPYPRSTPLSMQQQQQQARRRRTGTVMDPNPEQGGYKLG